MTRPKTRGRDAASTSNGACKAPLRIILGTVGIEGIFPDELIFTMKASPALLSTLKNLPENERFEIAMAILDECSPSGMSGDEIICEAASRQDELESGAVQDISHEELIAGLSYRPSGLAK